MPHFSWLAARSGLVRATARSARQHVAGAGVAILLAENASEWQARSPALRAQRTLATSVVVVNSSRLVTLVGSIRPRDALVQAVLEQADLTKASPFQSTGATPPEMFVGREREVADLLGILATNSAALIGGRKIGKTSLLHRVVETLTGEGWLPFYADLQEAGDWRTFAEHVRLRWNVEVPEAFAPVNIAELVEQLQGRGTGRLVLALDEIDHLLRWDQDHGGAYVPEAFFRACRALSQEGAAQFVFSGERTIAERLWDPVSPHWNFCKPLPVRQLSREAADRLLAAPLASLGVSLADRRACLDLAWARTHGHPQIVQMLGEEIINRLNDRDLSDRRLVRSQEIASIVETAQYCERYVTTYWGQATPYEQLISVLLVRGAQTQGELRGALKDLGMPSDVDRLRPALRMLNLYGILEGVDEQLALRAEWLPEAMEALGGADRLTDDLVDVPE